MNLNFRGKKVLVCGMAKSGIAAAELLCHLGARVTLQDLKKREEIGDVSLLEQSGITVYDGKNPDDIILNQELVIVSPGIPSDLPFLCKAKEAEIPVWSEVELAYLMTPCPVAAITGTNGKTTTTTLAGEMLKSQFPGTAVVGNIGVPYSSMVEYLTERDWIVAEISSFQLENTHKFHPRISAVLNISPDHLNRHKTIENYIATKERIFEEQDENDFCILNYDDVVCRKMAEKTKAKPFFFSSSRPLVEGIFLEEDTIKLRWHGLRQNIIHIDELQILGVHNYENVMAAVAIALCAGVKMGNIIKTLKEFKGVAHRIEYVATVDGVDYYNDSKGTNTDASIRAVNAMKKPIVLIGGGYDKGVSFDDWTATFPGKVKHLVLIGETAPQIQASAEKNGFTTITNCDTFEQAVDLCREIAQEGDCVLLSPACASWGMFDNYEQRGDLFKARVRSYLKSN
jgi:UDP-N-acetylmuramoylalanine--D-glutamate ligase